MTPQNSEDITSLIIKMRDGDEMGWLEIGQAVELHPEAARSRYRAAMKKGFDSEEVEVALLDEEARLIFDDKVKPDNVDWREFLDLAETNQRMEQRLSSTQRTADVTIKTDKPIAVMFSSDWHLGHKGTDYNAWQRDMNFLLETPDMYMIDLGDDRQNARRFRDLSMVFSQVLTPRQQALMIRSLINELTEKNKLLAKVRANHDVEFDERVFGEAVQSYLMEKMEAPDFNNRGLLKLKVGRELYSILLFHKSRFRSFLRSAHGNLREHQLSFPAEIVAGGHDHWPGFEILWRYSLAREAGYDFGGEVYLVKAGTYQIDSNYGWKYFHDGAIAAPTVVLWPDQHKKLIFMSPQDAALFLQAQRTPEKSPAA